MHRRISIGLLLFPLCTPSSAQTPPTVRVSVTEVREYRSNFIVPAKGKGADEGTDAKSLFLRLRVEGPAADLATRWGELRIDEAVDDRGNSLIPKVNAIASTQPGAMAPLTDDNVPPNARPKKSIPIELSIAARQAKNIARLRGHFTLLTARESRTLRFPKLKSLLETTLDDPVLKSAGVSLMVASDRNLGMSSDVFTIKPDYPGILQIGIVGVSVSVSHPQDLDLCYVNVNTPVSDDMTLLLELEFMQERMTVPFDLKNIPLP